MTERPELPEGAEAAPQEFQDAVQEADRAKLAVILDKAAFDPAWKQQLLDDPDGALAAIGQSGPPDIGEVVGQMHWTSKYVMRWTWYGGWNWIHWRW